MSDFEDDDAILNVNLDDSLSDDADASPPPAQYDWPPQPAARFVTAQVRDALRTFAADTSRASFFFSPALSLDEQLVVYDLVDELGMECASRVVTLPSAARVLMSATTSHQPAATAEVTAETMLIVTRRAVEDEEAKRKARAETAAAAAAAAAAEAAAAASESASLQRSFISSGSLADEMKQTMTTTTTTAASGGSTDAEAGDGDGARRAGSAPPSVRGTSVGFIMKNYAKGASLLSKVGGWRAGKGLGKDERGIVAPVETKAQFTRAGLRTDDEDVDSRRHFD